MTRKRWRWSIASVSAIICLISPSFPILAKGESYSRTSSKPIRSASDFSRTVRVLVLGSSVAHGWNDNPQDGGFLHRCFDAMSELTPVNYDLTDKAMPGRGVLTIRKAYPQWLDTYNPDIVVLGWGGLSDLSQKTPVSVYDNQIRWQISLALAHHAIVYVVTAPVSKASYTSYRDSQRNLMHHEIQIAENFHNPKVHVFNVFDQMKTYLTAHHETIEPFMGDGWHPNAAGHALAARLLLHDMMPKFDTSQSQCAGSST